MSRYDYDDLDRHYYQKSKSQLAAEQKNAELVYDLYDKRLSFAGLGTNKAKRRLNKLGNTDPIAKAVRLALEIEDKNISAKDSYGKYRDKIYRTKHKLILDLAAVFLEHKMVFGIESTKNFSASHVIYFDIPGCDQLSWHFSPNKEDPSFPQYPHKWDGLVNSTLPKLEKVAMVLLADANNIGSATS